MADFLLTVWAKDDPKNNADGELTKGMPISLWNLDPSTQKVVGDPIEFHNVGVDASDIDCSAFVNQEDGNAFNLESALTATGLSNDGLIQEIGNTLWNRLALGNMAAEIKKLLSQTCRIYLDLRSDILRSFPWELTRVDNLSLFSLEDTCWLVGRPESTDAAGKKTPVDWEIPMRIMVVIGNSPTDKKLNSELELEHIEFYAHNQNSEVLLNILTRPSAKELEQEFENFKPHVFHFIGHGGFDDSTPAKPTLSVFDAKRGKNDPLDIEKIKKITRKSPPRIVLLNACHSATTEFLTAKETKTLADAFLDSGCPAVLAMRGEIRDDSSLSFCEAFYKHFLEDGLSVERAVSAARNQLKDFASVSADADQNGIRSNWPLPRLTIYGNVNQLTHLTGKAPRLKEDCKPKPDFVDRWGYRWRTLQTIHPSRSRLVVLHGEKPTGKSELLRTLTAISVQRGGQALVVNGEPDSGDWQDLIQMFIHEAEEMGLDTAPLNAINLTKGSSQSDVAIPKFLMELEKIVSQETVLVIDGISHWKNEILLDIYRHLCKPFVDPDPDGIPTHLRMMIAIRDNPGGNTWGVFPDGWEPIEVSEFNTANGEWDRALRQMQRYWEYQIETKTSDASKITRFRNYVKSSTELGGEQGDTLKRIRDAGGILEKP